VTADKRAHELDAALKGAGPPDDPELAALVDSAAHLERALHVDPPASGGARAVFVSAVGARHRRLTVGRVVVPALAAAAVVVVLGALGSGTLPGDALFPVRRALASAGIVESPLEEAERNIGDVERSLERADDLLDESPAEARRLATRAIVDLDTAHRIASEVGAAERLERIAELREEATELIAESVEEAAESGAGNRGSGDARGDGSGPGPGDDSGSEAEDSSGPGGGDDSGSGGDDSSGPGGGGSSGSEGARGDSGSGGGDSGSGGEGDNSGPG
jgi:hypothetical protein